MDDAFLYTFLIVPFWWMNMLTKSRICTYLSLGSCHACGWSLYCRTKTHSWKGWSPHTSRKAMATSSSCRMSPYMAAHCKTRRMTAPLVVEGIIHFLLFCTLWRLCMVEYHEVKEEYPAIFFTTFTSKGRMTDPSSKAFWTDGISSLGPQAKPHLPKSSGPNAYKPSRLCLDSSPKN